MSNKKNYILIKKNYFFSAFNCNCSVGGDDFDYDTDLHTTTTINNNCIINNNNNIDINYDNIDNDNYSKTTTISIMNPESLNIFEQNNLCSKNISLLNDNEEEEYGCGIMIMGKNGECDILTDEEKKLRTHF